MRFAIVGAGRVGMRTARVLREEGHDVVLVEPEQTTVDRLRSEEFEVVHGDGSQEDVLQKVGLEDVDGLAALSGDLTVNFVACMIAKGHGCRTVLRADTDYREYVIQKYASDVDAVVYPERLGAILAKNALLGGNIRAIADVAHNLQLVELTVTDASPMRGYSLTELELPADARVLAVGKAEEPLAIPDDDISLEAGDRIVVIVDFEELANVERIVVGETTSRAARGGV